MTISLMQAFNKLVASSQESTDLTPKAPEKQLPRGFTPVPHRFPMTSVLYGAM
jgi:hypothetical protein